MLCCTRGFIFACYVVSGNFLDVYTWSSVGGAGQLSGITDSDRKKLKEFSLQCENKGAGAWGYTMRVSYGREMLHWKVNNIYENEESAASGGLVIPAGVSANALDRTFYRWSFHFFYLETVLYLMHIHKNEVNEWKMFSYQSYWKEKVECKIASNKKCHQKCFFCNFQKPKCHRFTPTSIRSRFIYLKLVP